MTDFMSKRPARGGGDARSVSRELNANRIHWDTLNFGRLDVTDLKAGDGDRTRDVQGRKSLSVMPKHLLGPPWVQLGSRDDAIPGS